MPSDTDILRKAGRDVGQVQGVNFRVFVRNSAQALGVTGWVKNMNDGSVTMELQGSAQILGQLIDKIKQGRGRIKVNALELADLPVVEGEDRSAIRH